MRSEFDWRTYSVFFTPKQTIIKTKKIRTEKAHGLLVKNQAGVKYITLITMGSFVFLGMTYFAFKKKQNEALRDGEKPPKFYQLSTSQKVYFAAFFVTMLSLTLLGIFGFSALKNDILSDFLRGTSESFRGKILSPIYTIGLISGVTALLPIFAYNKLSEKSQK